MHTRAPNGLAERESERKWREKKKHTTKIKKMLSVSIGGNYDSEFLYQPSKWNLPPTAKSLTRRQHCVVQLQLICMHCSRQRWSFCARNNIHTSGVKRMIDGSPMMSFHSHAKALARVVCQLTMSYIFNVLKLELFWLWSSNWVSHYIYFHSFINFPSITANFFAPSFATLPAASHDVHWTGVSMLHAFRRWFNFDLFYL